MKSRIGIVIWTDFYLPKKKTGSKFQTLQNMSTKFQTVTNDRIIFEPQTFLHFSSEMQKNDANSK